MRRELEWIGFAIAGVFVAVAIATSFTNRAVGIDRAPHGLGVVAVEARDAVDSATACAAPLEEHDVIWDSGVVAEGRRVRGLVLDSRTCRGLAQMTIEWASETTYPSTREGSCRELATTDTDGRFVADLAFPVDGLRYTVRDADGEFAAAVRPSAARSAVDGEELVLLADVGPTWRVHVQATKRVRSGSQFVDTVEDVDGKDVLVRLGSVDPRHGVGGLARFTAWRAMQDGEPPWVRFSLDVEFAGGVAWAEFRTRDGLLAASTRLEEWNAEQVVVLHRTARVFGKVTCADSKNVREFSLAACRGAGGPEATYDQMSCWVDGAFDLRGIDAGPVRSLELRRGGEFVRRIDLDLVPGDAREFDFEL